MGRGQETRADTPCRRPDARVPIDTLPFPLRNHSKTRFLGASPFIPGPQFDADVDRGKPAALPRRGGALGHGLTKDQDDAATAQMAESGSRTGRHAMQQNGGVVWTSEVKHAWRLQRFRPFQKPDDLLRGGASGAGGSTPAPAPALKTFSPSTPPSHLPLPTPSPRPRPRRRPGSSPLTAPSSLAPDSALFPRP